MRLRASLPPGVQVRFISILLLVSLLTGVNAIAAPAATSLLDALAPVLADPMFKQADVGIHMVNLRTGEEVASVNAGVPLNPASTMKLITTATALRTLGPTYRFKTVVASTSAPTAAGVIEGDLFVKGGGDPSLVVEKLWKLGRDLRLQGVTSVVGDLVLDDSFFDAETALIGWDKARDLDHGPAYFPTLSALSVNFNTTALIVGPGTADGKAARVELETPASGYVEIVNQAVTRPGSRRLEIERQVLADRTRFTVTGVIPLGADVRRTYRAIGDPTTHFGAAFREILAGHGIAVGGVARRGITPDAHVQLVVMESVPLTNVLMDMNKYSNNFMAEQVLKTVAAEASQRPGSTADGVAIVREYLASVGVVTDGLSLVNGSGLTRDGRLRAADLTKVLVDMQSDHRVAGEFATSLAIAGQDGTLARRLEAEAGRLRGKTGTLDGVHCLAGYIEGGDGDRYAFAFLLNGNRPTSSRVRALQDSFARGVLGSGDGTGDVHDTSEGSGQ